MAHVRGKRGTKYRSKLEARVAKRLQNMKLPFEYEPFKMTYTKEYTLDFLVNDIILEVKGVLRPEDRSKMIQVKRDNPDKDIRFIFQVPHRKMIHSKMTHAEWADKNGFLWYGENDFKKKDFVPNG